MNMTLFEYLAAGHTLILTFALTRVLSGVAVSVEACRRSWLHLSWLGFVVANSLFTFWAMWGYIEVEWTLIRFMGLLSVPIFVYIFSSIIVPQNLSEIDSCRNYFFDKRISIFVTGALWFIAIVLSNQLIQGTSPLHWLQITLYATIGVFVIGAATANERIHGILALWPPIFFVLLSVQLYQPGDLFR